MERREIFFLSVGLLAGAIVARLLFRVRTVNDVVLAERVRERLRNSGRTWRSR